MYSTVKQKYRLVWFMLLNATLHNSSVITWWSVLLVDETGVPVENHQPVTSHWQTLSHNVVSSMPRLTHKIINRIQNQHIVLYQSVSWEIYYIHTPYPCFSIILLFSKTFFICVNSSWSNIPLEYKWLKLRRWSSWFRKEQHTRTSRTKVN